MTKTKWKVALKYLIAALCGVLLFLGYAAVSEPDKRTTRGRMVDTSKEYKKMYGEEYYKLPPLCGSAYVRLVNKKYFYVPSSVEELSLNGVNAKEENKAILKYEWWKLFIIEPLILLAPTIFVLTLYEPTRKKVQVWKARSAEKKKRLSDLEAKVAELEAKQKTD